MGAEHPLCPPTQRAVCPFNHPGVSQPHGIVGGGWEEGVKVAREPIPIAMEMGDGLFPWQQHTGPILLPLGVGDPNVFSIASGCRGGGL